MTFDPTKPVRTRDGRPARIICTDLAANIYTIVAAVVFNGLECVERYTADGEHLWKAESGWDLVNVPVKHVRWVNFYGPVRGLADHSLRAYVAADEADNYARAGRIACVRVEFEEGEGL